MRQMSVRLDKRNRPEPDVLVFRAEGNRGPGQTWYDPTAVVLAVEVVSEDSEDSEERDLHVKPHKYAAAGIPHFWRVESNERPPVVYMYELDCFTEEYTLTGIHHDRLKLTVPFPLDIDLTAVTRRPSRPQP